MMMLFPTRSLAVYLRAFTFCLLITSPLATRAAEKVTDTTIWRDVSEWGVEGQGWLPADLHSRYDRLPAKAEKIVRPPVWSLSRDSAGIAFRFNTDATTIQIRYTVGDKAIALPHMPATGVSGVDLYDRQRHLEVGRCHPP